MQEANGFGSLQYLNSNAPIYGSKLTVAPVPGLDDASLFHQGAPSVAASARVGATPYWSLDDSAMTNTGMSDVFQKRQAPFRPCLYEVSQGPLSAPTPTLRSGCRTSCPATAPPSPPPPYPVASPSPHQPLPTL